MRKIIAVFLLSLPVPSQATVNVTFTSSAPPMLQDEFIAGATNQYIGTLTKSPFFSNTYSFSISAKNPTYQPPIVSSPIPTATAFQECMAYGFGNGMDEERKQNIDLVWGLHRQDVINGTCAGMPISVSTSPVSISSTTCTGFCQNVYGVVVSTISERSGNIYDSMGNKVAP